MEQSQEERVLQHQLAIAEAMKVKPEILEVLRLIEKWEIREWLYICALDGMDCAQIKKLAEGTVADIKAARKELSGGNILLKELHALEAEVKTVCQENRDVRAVIEKKLIEERERQEREYKGKLKIQENLLSRQRKTIIEMKEQMDAANKDLESLKEEKAELCQKSENHINHEILNPESEKQGIRTFFIRKKRKKEIRRFIENYLQEDSLSEEQKEYLLTCLEAGESVSDMARYALPGLSVDQMNRIRKLKGRRR